MPAAAPDRAPSGSSINVDSVEFPCHIKPLKVKRQIHQSGAGWDLSMSSVASVLGGCEAVLLAGLNVPVK